MDKLAVKTRKLTRDKLALFLPNQELIKAFEDLHEDVAQSIVTRVNDLVDAVDDLQQTSPLILMSAVAEIEVIRALAYDAERQTMVSQIGGLREELTDLARCLADLQRGPSHEDLSDLRARIDDIERAPL